MDPVTLVVAALAAGATKGLGDSASDLVKSTYQSLRTRIVNIFASDSKALATLEDHEDDPDTYDKPMIKLIERTDLAGDEEITRLAARLMELVDPDGADRGKYRVSVSGGQVGIIGDHGTVTLNPANQPH